MGKWLEEIDSILITESQQPTCLLIKGKLYFLRKNFELAIELLSSIQESSLKNEKRRRELLILKSKLYFELNKPEKAFSLLEEEGNKESPQSYLFWVQWIRFKIMQGEYEKGREKIQNLTQKYGNHLPCLALLQLLSSRILLRLGEYKEGFQKAKQAGQIFYQLGELAYLHESWLIEANILKEQYRWEESLPLLKRAYSLALLLEEPSYIWKTLTLLGEIEYLLGEKKKGSSHLLEAIFLANQEREPEGLCELLMILGKIHLHRKDISRAEVLMRKARELSKEKNIPYLLARVDFLSAQVGRLLGDESIEEALRERALRTFHDLGNRKEFCEVLLDKLTRRKEKGIYSESGFLKKFKDALTKLEIPYLLQEFQKLEENE
ncbi:MAG: hypothetical protein D6785_11040 [Planctomycetota bacterium]|nr:MAG: hypothetical protein D6785_11040 [Planctomycetota bacterium]